MIIKNPTDKSVSITIRGRSEEVMPGGYVEVPEDFASDWVKTHAFLQAVNSIPVEPTEASEAPKEEVEETKEEPKPKRRRTKKE